MNARHQHRHGPPSSELDPSGFQQWITWGNLQTQTITAAGAATIPGVLGTPAQLVQLQYERPTSWSIQLAIDLTQGNWLVGDVVFVQWQITLACGKAIFNQRILQTLHITPGEPGAPTVVQSTTIQQAAAHRINIVPSQVGWTVADALPRIFTWGAWCAPLVR